MSSAPGAFRRLAFEDSAREAMNNVAWAFRQRGDGRAIAMFQGVLAAESRRWLELGMENGYFGSEPDERFDAAFDPESWPAEPDVGIFFPDPYIVVGTTDFSGEFVAALTDLGRGDRVNFLYRLFFAAEDAWEDGLAVVSEVAGRLAEWPQRSVPSPMLNQIEWAITGPEPGGLAKDCPANWRLSEPFHPELDEGVFESVWRRWAALEPLRDSIGRSAQVTAEAMASEVGLLGPQAMRRVRREIAE